MVGNLRYSLRMPLLRRKSSWNRWKIRYFQYMMWYFHFLFDYKLIVVKESYKSAIQVIWYPFVFLWLSLFRTYLFLISQRIHFSRNQLNGIFTSNLENMMSPTDVEGEIAYLWCWWCLSLFAVIDEFSPGWNIKKARQHGNAKTRFRETAISGESPQDSVSLSGPQRVVLSARTRYYSFDM